MFIESYNKPDGHFNITKYYEDIKAKTEGRLFIAKEDIECEDGVITADSVVSIDARRIKNLGRRPQPSDVEVYIGVFDKKYAIEKETNNFERIPFIRNRFQYHKLKDHKVKSIEVGLFWFEDYFTEALSEEESLDVLLNGFDANASELCQKLYEHTNVYNKTEKQRKIFLTLIFICFFAFVCFILIPRLKLGNMPSNVICYLLSFLFFISTVISIINFAKKRAISRNIAKKILDIDSDFSLNVNSLMDNLEVLFSDIEHYHVSQSKMPIKQKKQEKQIETLCN